MSTLLLRLAAPLQAWGTDSKFETRRTGREPSKSGVVGLLAAALGIRRDGDLSRLNALRFGVRVDREGCVIRDYHTARSEKAAYITNRYYLSDAVFLVGLECGDEAFLCELSDALNHPAFPLFLGRRACPPTPRLVLGVRSSGLDAALAEEPWLCGADRPAARPTQLRIVTECRATDDLAVRVRDLPLSFDPQRRQYGFRASAETLLPFPAPVPGKTEHDPMSEL